MPKKDTAPAILDVHWSEDMTWSLLSEVEKDDNRLVLLGKREKKENTSGDSKITVFQQIGAVVLPESYKLNPTAGVNSGLARVQRTMDNRYAWRY
ncbi:hypothetical protein DFH29DRAFT_963638 [Suillus ampliporus]|nr:hypothetical protein DFH29DRAFT_963638 [Suillus ampliporus]